MGDIQIKIVGLKKGENYLRKFKNNLKKTKHPKISYVMRKTKGKIKL